MVAVPQGREPQIIGHHGAVVDLRVISRAHGASVSSWNPWIKRLRRRSYGKSVRHFAPPSARFVAGAGDDATRVRAGEQCANTCERNQSCDANGFGSEALSGL